MNINAIRKIPPIPPSERITHIVAINTVVNGKLHQNGGKVFLNSVNEYFVLGGTTGYILRLTSPSCSNSRSCCTNILLVALGIEKISKGANIYGAPLAIIVCADHKKAWVRPF